MEPANAVILSATRSCASEARLLNSSTTAGWCRTLGSSVGIGWTSSENSAGSVSGTRSVARPGVFHSDAPERETPEKRARTPRARFDLLVVCVAAEVVRGCAGLSLDLRRELVGVHSC